MTGRHAYFLLFLFAAASMLCACSKEEADCAFDEKKEIIFGCGSIELLVDGTKADVTSLSTLNVLCQKGDMGSLTQQWSLTDMTVSSGTVSTGRYWPSESAYSAMGGYHFYASNTTICQDASGACIDVDCNSGLDCIGGAAYSPTYGVTVPIVCVHVQSKLGNVKVTPAVSGYSVSDLSVILRNVAVSGRRNLHSGIWTVSATEDRTIAARSDAFTSWTSTARSGEYLIPGSYTVQATYTVTRGSYTYTQSEPVTAAATFAAGVASNLNVTLPIVEQTDPTLGVTVSVTGWTTGADCSETM